jgi:uncharacterized protein YceK
LTSVLSGCGSLAGTISPPSGHDALAAATALEQQRFRLSARCRSAYCRLLRDRWRA